MRYVLSIGGAKYLLTAEQVARIAEVITDAESVTSKWIGGGSGSVNVLSDAPLSERLTINLMSQAEYDLLKFTTASVASK
jgi:hypothetical protein